VTYILAMSKRPRAKLYEWRITRIRSTPAALIGYVQAPDAEPRKPSRDTGSATQQQARLAAQRVKEIG
jgi:hypothetical protein